MKKITLGILGASALLIASTCFANTDTDSATLFSGTYLQVEGGGSFSNSENFHPQRARRNWTPINDDFPSRIGNSFLYGLGLGYRYNSFVRIDLTYSQRNNFKYDKTSYAATDGRHRTFDINNKTLLANIYFNLNGLRQKPWMFDPFVGFGAGYAWNSTNNFDSTYANGSAQSSAPYSQNSGRKNGSIAWQASAGITAHLFKHLDADLGYRYLNIGKVTTGTMRAEGSAVPETSKTIDPLTASTTDMQEVYLNVRYII